MKRVALALTLLMLTLVPAASATPTSASTCRPDPTLGGICFETLPKLWCCSAAFLGWSEINVGDRFPVAGQVEPPAETVGIRFPSGKVVTMSVDPQGAFGEVVTFDEEGVHQIYVVRSGSETELARFTVAYHAELVELPTVEQQFGNHHRRSSVTVGVVEADQPAQIGIRFTDAQGQSVANQTLAIGFGEERYTTNAQGVATLTYLGENPSGYAINRLYPGLAVITARSATLGSDGLLSGLPGGTVQAIAREGRWYLPLRESLEKAAPWRLGDMPERITWNGSTRTVHVAGLTLMVDTGMVLGQQDFRADVHMASGTTYISLGSLVEVLDQIGMAIQTGDATFLISMAEEP